LFNKSNGFVFAGFVMKTKFSLIIAHKS